jgi:hypothetical protein
MTNLKIKPGPRIGMTMEDRFWEKVKKGNGCWEWQGALSKQWQYGMFRVNAARPTVKAHRVSWEINVGQIPEGVNVLHKCDNPKCVRPDHLFLGTIGDNNQDMTLKERHGRMLFTHEQVRQIRELKKARGRSLSHQMIADQFGVSKSTITHMLTGRNWKYA